MRRLLVARRRGGGGTARLLDDVVAARLGVARDAVWAGRARADVLEPQE
ncbi:hypothetical protein [Streptomyces sudanensis]|nr:hypothetical protein [Streptomyces sudanensis]MCP9958419.1 hypothetical protein [Streptomyces sudanensis]